MRRFKVIKGGADNGPPQALDWRSKFAQLRAIEVTLSQQEQARRSPSTIGPRHALGMLSAVVVCSAVVSVLYVFDPDPRNLTLGPWATVGLIFGLPVAVRLLVMRYSKRPLTYAAKLNTLLADYDPISPEAYRQLQDRTRHYGYFEYDFVKEWLDQERRVIEDAAGIRKREDTRFLDKKV